MPSGETVKTDVLRFIGSSQGELGPVFQAMLENATRICGAPFGTLLISRACVPEGSRHNLPRTFGENATQHLKAPFDGAPSLRQVVSTKRLVHIVDIASEHPEDPIYVLGGARSILCVPMIKDDALVGCINVYRQEVRPFADKQIELLTNFAAQAVIAIENARLLAELRQRTDDLAESLEQQTATSEVLSVISSSPGDLQPVFEAMLENAVRICGASFGNIYRWDGKRLNVAATYNVPPAFAEARRRSPHTHGPKTVTGRMLATKQPVHLADAREQEAYIIDRDPGVVAAVEIGGVRALLSVPLLKDGELIGAFTVYRQEVLPFTDKQIALLENFAAQAVIAIENARLLSELREALEQQTATADVLRVISGSLGDLTPVFDAILANAARLCEAQFGNLLLSEDDSFRFAATHNAPTTFAERWQSELFRPSPVAPIARAIAAKHFVHVVNLKDDPAYLQGDPPITSLVDMGGARTLLIVPMIKDAAVIGALTIFRQEVRAFTDKQITLVTSFADQAVIAIENARLLTELRKSLQQQTATADVLKVISRSAFDLQTVLDTLLQTAARLCEADQGTVTQRKGDTFYHSVSYGFPTAFAEYVKERPVELSRDTATGRALMEGRVIHIPDVEADPEYTWKEAQRLGGFRTLLGVPMLRDGVAVGVLTLMRTEARPFTDKQIELVSTFADQAAIAIENVRLFEKRRNAHPGTGSLAAGPAYRPGSPCSDREARLARPAHRRHRSRDQKSAQLRQQFLVGLHRSH